jgi:hypothetical protein
LLLRSIYGPKGQPLKEENMSNQLTESECRERQRQLEEAYPRSGKKPEKKGATAPKQAANVDTAQEIFSRSSHHSA